MSSRTDSLNDSTHTQTNEGGIETIWRRFC